MNQSRCEVCDHDVAVICCHYKCMNCGHDSDWDTKIDASSAYDKNDETLLINILDKKEANGKER